MTMADWISAPKLRSRARTTALCLCLAIISGVSVTRSKASSVPSAASGAPDHFQGRSWTEKDGAPRGIVSVAQTPDGYLWLATADGLFRFDGIAFEEIRPPQGSAMAAALPQVLLVSREGELWIGYSRSAGVAVYRNGHLVDTGLPDPPTMINNLVQGADGTIWGEWGGLSRRLWRYRNGRWSQVGEGLHLPPGYTLGLVATRDGSLWVPVLAPDQRSAGIARLSPGSSRFAWLGGGYQMPRLSRARDGALWLVDRDELMLFRDSAQRPPDRPIHFKLPVSLRRATLTFDPLGDIWGSTRAGETFMVPAAALKGGDPRPEIRMIDKSDWIGKSGPPLLIDRDGAIWSGREGELTRFRYADVGMDPAIASDSTRGIRLASGTDGVVYVVSNQMLYRIKPGGMAHPALPIGNPSAICGGRDGSVWILDDHVARQWKPAGTGRRLADLPTFISRCAEDRLSRLWVRGYDGSTWWHDKRGWHLLKGYEGASGTSVGQGVVANAAGDIAISTDRPGLGVVEGSDIRRYDFRALGIDEITMVSPALRGFLVAGRRGLLRVRDGKVRKLDARLYPWTARLSGVVQTPRGETWLRVPTGIARVSSAQLDKAFDHPGFPLDLRIFDQRDGLVGGPAMFGFPTRTMAVDGGGRIWAVTARGLAMIDPANLHSGHHPISVAIRSAETHPGLVRDPVSLTLPPGTTTVRFTFAAMGLADPERVRILYRLEGLETQWTDPGIRRATTYTNLSPGRYRFEVVAANQEGEWNRKGATVDLVIKPTFFQDWPFKVMCAATILVLLWGAYQLRLRTLAARIQARLADRHDERERIARELHDTLAQSVQALILRVHLASRGLPPENPVRKDLEKTLEQAQKVLREARERIRDLRSLSVPDTLEPAITRAGVERGFVPGTSLLVATCGEPRPLHPSAATEIVRIAEEALFNIAQHAQASRVEIDIEYRPNSIQIIFRDDGVGISPEILRTGKREGHYGLVGMRERAARLHGDMMFDKGAGGGAEVILILPASTAYDRHRCRWRWNPFRR
jgi:signal transduction histidine kinase